MAHTKREAVSGTLVNLSMLLYMTWLLLPAVQTTLRAVTGVLAVGLFGVGAMLAGGTLGGRIRWLAAGAVSGGQRGAACHAAAGAEKVREPKNSEDQCRCSGRAGMYRHRSHR